VTIVFDSGNWISAIRFGGVPQEAILHALQHDRIAICAEIEEEVIRNLRLKFGFSEVDVRSEMTIFLANSILVKLQGTLTGICRDPKDDFILECALNGNADLIVTGDKDLLSLQSFLGIQIVTPRQYLDRANAPAGIQNR
jgi:putative PIN family toxin of toxin-antitoxin system